MALVPRRISDQNRRNTGQLKDLEYPMRRGAASCSPHFVLFIILPHCTQYLPWGPPEARALARLDFPSAVEPLFFLNHFGRPQTPLWREQKAQHFRKFYITVKSLPRKLYLCQLFIFQDCSCSLFFFPLSSRSSVLSLVNNAYCSCCYADRQRKVLYRRIKLYHELQCNSCNLVPCGQSGDSESIRDPCSVLTDKVTGDTAQCLTFGLFPT